MKGLQGIMPAVGMVIACVTLSPCHFVTLSPTRAAADTAPLQAGFAETDITPKLGDKPVYMAGFGQNRKATKVHDPIMARAVVLKHGAQKVAMVSVDLVG